MNKSEIDLIKFNRIIATKLIESGNEINRVEEIINNIIISQGFNNPNVFAISTGIFYSFDDNNKINTDVIRVKKRGTDLKSIIIYTKLAEKVINKEITINKAINRIKEKNDKKHSILKVISAGLSTGFFAVLYGGNNIDFFISFFCGIIIELITIEFKRVDIFHFLNSLICSFVSTIIAILMLKVLPNGNLDNIVIGSIMLILPGLTLTNSIKDIIMGNLVSGSSRLSEALFVAVAISIGVIIAIMSFQSIGGVI